MKCACVAGARRDASGEAGALPPRDLQHYVLLLGQEPERAADVLRGGAAAGEAARVGDRLHRARALPRPLLLQHGQPQRREALKIN
jgi:hypothetical protein